MGQIKIEIIRHSLAHILAAAVQELYPGVKFGIGPVIENGFYYDFDLSALALGERGLSSEDLPKIKKKMREIIKKDVPFQRQKISKEEVKKIFKNQPYKEELINELKEKEATIYKTGNFIDFCKGPHIKSTQEINPDSFKLTKIAGAYWRGDEKNPMLTRVYGAAFETEKDLKDYLELQKEIKKRDHRKIGKSFELFTFSDEVGKGLPLWQPKGTIIREELEKWAKETEKKEGYMHVITPHITKGKLYETSGHLPYYAEDMYPPFEIEKEKYYLKPMNCPHHHMIYKSKNRSWRDLPLRIAEYGTVYRYERSGTLYGLMRVRGFTMNDAHIYCALEKAKEEFIKVMKMHEFYYKKLGIKNFYMELSLRDSKDNEKYHGDKKMWQTAEYITKQAMKESKIPYVEKIGGAAFYGPKIDFIIETVTIKEYAISTNQLDLYMAERFGLTYVDKDGKGKTPVIIHRAPLGAHERFIGFLIEHYAGAFPVWLSPVQVQIIPIASRHNKYARKVVEKIREISGKFVNIRGEIKDENETVSKKIREGELQKIPYMLVVGDKEEKANRVAVRDRQKGDIGTMKIEKFAEKIVKEIENKE